MRVFRPCGVGGGEGRCGGGSGGAGVRKWSKWCGRGVASFCRSAALTVAALN